MSDDTSDTNMENNQPKIANTRSKRKKNEDYIETQLKTYILRLKSDNIPTLIGVEPNSIDANQWSTFLETAKKASEESKCTAEWTYVSALFSISVTQSSRIKAAYDHITDLISKLESQNISREIWYTLLCKAGITFCFLCDSNFKRKKIFELYEEFIDLLVFECKKKM
ncbi:31683_t:CDS:2 [Gigaspora margarita]|uniref:31683_t:CDS:1 n=1 Tax=Gigaspora margarita TaxID=4874 RepID=A0ABN7V3R6_GIGMA|nr:31683_t:CDS:2 [Gigaspora margarita]